MRTSYYTIYIGKDGQPWFNLKAANNEIILKSEGYSSKKEAENGIESVRENSQMDERYVRKVNKAGEPYFVLTAKNGKTIGVSESYSSVQAMEKGIAAVKRCGTTLVVKDLTDKKNPPDEKVIFVNKEKFKVDEDSMTGEEILALAGFTPDKYDLFIKKGNDDSPVEAGESVALKNGMHFRAILKEIPFG